MKYKIVFAFYLLIVTSKLSASSDQINCKVGYFAFDVKQFECLNKSFLTENLKRSFREILSLRKNCASCKEPFPEAFQYQNIFDTDFLVLNVKVHDFGGFQLSILTRNNPLIYQFWLYPIEKDTLQLRSINSYRLRPNTTEQMVEFAKEEKFAKYWLNASSPEAKN